ncbi:MAG: tRNA (N(6)-L-threonylcarbamoyladenosine(37)-C(2))-methylthiotransferase MtaB [Deltaproteobacteria bacterium]|nr:tRNA (N(6)-L-threonylcarbamoyladenosine(37)-C(2))-methylthiotransferase MtaB [Deltaproteobacteria bacterium]
MNVLLQTLGCRLNEAELQTWAHTFAQKGHRLTQDTSEADLIVVNTCAVTKEATKKSRQSIRKLHQSAPSAKVVVSGCYAQLEHQVVKDLLGVDLVVGNKEKDQLVEHLHRELDLDIPTMPASALDPDATPLFSKRRARAFLKVQDGCRYSCTYCIVTKARGEERSKSIGELVDEVNTLHRNGIFEVVLAGVHVGGYGSDLNTDLQILVQALLHDTDMPRIRFASVEPWDLPPAFFSLFQNPRLLPHMHLPLQSGHNAVLKKMARRCKTEDFAALVERAREEIPNFNVTTDIIVGFPTETRAMFDKTLRFVRQVGFGHIHIFQFSPREGTFAATMPQTVDATEKKTRSKALHELAAELKQDFLLKQLGREDEVLLESFRAQKHPFDDNAHFVGYGRNFSRVHIDAESIRKAGCDWTEGCVVKVQLDRVDGDNSEEKLWAEPVDESEILRPRRAKGALPIL